MVEIKIFKAADKTPNGLKAAVREILDHPLIAQSQDIANKLESQLLILKRRGYKCSKK